MNTLSKAISILSILMIISTQGIEAIAQTQCFTTNYNKAEQLYRQGSYAEAKRYYKAASACPDKPKQNNIAARISDCDNAINEIRQREEAERVVETVTEESHTLESVVTFRQGRTNVDASQLPNVERIATYLNNHKDATVVIRGYASPEGSKEVNERIARQRAEAVKDVLTKRYRINERRITTEGQGVGDMFSEPDWDRVSICTIVDE